MVTKAKRGRAARPRKASARKKTAPPRKRLAPRKRQDATATGEVALDLGAAELAPIRERIQAAGGRALAAYREPLSGQPLLLCSLPLKSVEPTPFQRDLSPTHAKRLAEKIEESGAFLDPVIVVAGAEGKLWSPNGRHRLAAAKHLGLSRITALVALDEHLAFRILALNTEKAHNLRDRSLEVIRMARELARRAPRAKEIDHAAELEAPELLTLGVVYEQNKRFAGGAYRPFLRKVDRFAETSLRASLRKRADWAARLSGIDDDVKGIIKKLQARGFKSPFLRTYVVARINPVRWHRAKKGEQDPPMTIAAALTRMAAGARKFDVESVRPGEIALVAAASGPEE